MKYLASFRTSPWDVNENLPLDYARIFKFKRWSHAKIRAKKWRPEVAETIAAGQKITIGKYYCIFTKIQFDRQDTEPQLLFSLENG